MSPDGWKQFRNCKDVPLGLFFEEYEDSVQVQLEVDDICNGCVVRQQCLDYAIENDLVGGVFGGKFITEKFIAKRKGKLRV